MPSPADRFTRYLQAISSAADLDRPGSTEERNDRFHALNCVAAMAFNAGTGGCNRDKDLVNALARASHAAMEEVRRTYSQRN